MSRHGKRKAGGGKGSPHVRMGSKAGEGDPHGAAQASWRAGRQATQQPNNRGRLDTSVYPNIRTLAVPFKKKNM